MSLQFDIEQEVRDAYERLRKSRTPNHCILLEPVESSLSVKLLEEHPEGVTLDDMAEKLPKTEPRFIISVPERTHKDGRKSYPIVLVAYCPPGLSPQVNIVYSNARIQLAKEFNLTNVWEIKKKYQLGDEELAEKFETNKW